jgi:peptide-methionine (S)-S-oxide reductase
LEKAAIFEAPIVTEITSFEAFYPAESYHENYFEGHQEEPYCKFVIQPKLQKFIKTFSEDLKD